MAGPLRPRWVTKSFSSKAVLVAGVVTRTRAETPASWVQGDSGPSRSRGTRAGRGGTTRRLNWRARS